MSQFFLRAAQLYLRLRLVGGCHNGVTSTQLTDQTVNSILVLPHIAIIFGKLLRQFAKRLDAFVSLIADHFSHVKIFDSVDVQGQIVRVFAGQ